LGTFSSCRILVVDDFHPWRAFVCALVGTRKQWLIVGEAADGMEAIEKAVETKPDVILLDVGLPALSGIDASSRLCESVPGVRVVFLTAYQNREIVHAAFSNGAQGYVLKTHAHSELLTAVEAVLRGEKFLSSRIQR